MGTIEEFKELKEKVEKRQSQFNRAEAALEAANSSLKELLATVKEQYGVSSYKKLVELREGLEKEAELFLADIRSKLESVEGEEDAVQG